MDNLIADGKSKPMIVVMPNAYWSELASLDLAGPRKAAPSGRARRRRAGSAGRERNRHRPRHRAVREQHFRTMPGAANRAMAGLSMGCGITANVGLKRLDVFGPIGLLSGGMFRGSADAPGGVAAMDRINPAFRTDPAGTDEKLRLLFLSCGTEDPRIDGMKQAADESRGKWSVERTSPLVPAGSVARRPSACAFLWTYIVALCIVPQCLIRPAPSTLRRHYPF